MHGSVFSALSLTSLAASIVHGAAIPPCNDAPVVDLGYTKYAGTALSNGINQFLGMRYAAPVTGDRRFRQAQPPLSVSSTQNATSHGPVCYGVKSAISGDFPITFGEDCLFIDVYAPAERHHPLPVMLWFQGGAFVQLFNPNYNGTGLALAGDVIVVSFNYRAGPYGFLANDELAEEGNLNIGLYDQRFAMKWVEQHIHAFGGDPNQITLFGTSVGGGTVALQPLLFGGKPSADEDVKWKSGIAEAIYAPSVFEVSEQEFQYQHLLKATGCADLECLRDLPSDQLQAANLALPFPGQEEDALFGYGPVVDGKILPAHSSELLEQGRFARDKPLVLGTSRTEGTIFAPQANTTNDVNVFLRIQYPNLSNSSIAKIDQLYGNTSRTLPGVQASLSPDFFFATEAYGDAGFTCPALTFAQSYSAAGIPTHFFIDHILDPVENAAGYIVPHTWEVQAVWGPEYATNYVALPGADSYNAGGVNAGSVKIVQDYWTSFVKTGDVNILKARNAPLWTPYFDSYLRLQTNGSKIERVESDLKEKCAFWNSIRDELRQ